MIPAGAKVKVGVIGGSGIYAMQGLTQTDEVKVETPFGDPSDRVLVGTLNGSRVAFLPRHGRGHRLLPSEVPSRANIFALKLLGVESIIAASAVGSLQAHIKPLDMVVPDQLFDRTKNRPSTFFGSGIVAHIAFAHPFCQQLRDALLDASNAAGSSAHSSGTYVCMEGPAFSTYAESATYRQLGFDVIGMTALPEAKLAREAGMRYAMLAQVTDYDCWHPDHDEVTNDLVLDNVAKNATRATQILRMTIDRIEDVKDCSCRHALDEAIATTPERIDTATRRRLAPLFGEV